MGVAPEAIAESFGYRLKKIDKPAPYPFSHHLSILFAFAMDFSSLYIASPRVEDKVNLCFLTDIFLFPALFSLFFERIFFLDTLIPLYYLHYKNLEVHFGLCRFRGPLVRAYK
jgi:hypothetical protein